MEQINDFVHNGGHLSHILFIDIKNAPSEEIKYIIREEIFMEIFNKRIVRNFYNMHDVDITWQTIYDDSTKLEDKMVYYHTHTGGLWGDNAVNQHTKVVLNDLIKKIDDRYENMFSKGVMQLSFIVLKPVTMQIAML